MHRFISGLLTTGAALGLSVSAFAADMPMKAPAYIPAPMLNNWSGVYVGLNAGYSWGHSSIDYVQDAGQIFGNPPFPTGGALSTSVDPGSFIGGGQLGFNYQSGIWVFGAEADIAWRDRTDTASFTLNPIVLGPGGGGGDTLLLSDEQKWIGTVRGRVGVSPEGMSNWLFYVTGGLAYGGFEHSVTQNCNVGCGQVRVISDSTTKVGWTVGGGVEVALNRNWSVGAEYLYMDFGTDTLAAPAAGDFSGVTTTFPPTTVSFHDKSQVARLKLNYRFGDLGLH
ncbi:MAG TPA: outer membrane beta-barrel protein [Pirellulales bacterium]|jgi:outer membrane immunogenic protein